MAVLSDDGRQKIAATVLTACLVIITSHWTGNLTYIDDCYYTQPCFMLHVSGCRCKVRSCAPKLGLCSRFTQTVPDDAAGGIVTVSQFWFHRTQFTLPMPTRLGFSGAGVWAYMPKNLSPCAAILRRGHHGRQVESSLPLITVLVNCELMSKFVSILNVSWVW